MVSYMIYVQLQISCILPLVWQLFVCAALLQFSGLKFSVKDVANSKKLY